MQFPRQKTRYIWMRLSQALLILVAGFLAAFSAIDGVAKYVIGDFHALPAVRIAGAAVMILALLAVLRTTQVVKKILNPDTSLGRPRFTKAQAAEIREVLEQIKDVADGYAKVALEFFGDSLIFPNLYATRVTEEAVIDQGTLRLDTTITLGLPQYVTEEPERLVTQSHLQPTIVVPLVRAKKGAMLDNLKIEGAGGSLIPALPQRETKLMISYIVSDIYWRAYISETSPFNIHDLSPEQRQVLTLLLIAITQIGEISSDLSSALKLMLGEPNHSVNTTLAEYLIALLDFVTEYYVVAVEIPFPSSKYLIIKHSHQLPLFEQTATVKDKLRLRLGLTPYRFTIPLYWPFVAESYHFRMQGTLGQYVVDQSFFRLDDQQIASVVRQEDFAAQQPRPYLRARYHAGLPYAHFYTRDLNKTKAFNLCTRVEFAEVPPGTLGSALAVSLATTVLIGVFTLLNGRGNELSAILLASPAFAASFLGFGGDTQSLLRTSLSARFGLFASGILSFGSALISTAENAGRLPHDVVSFSLLGGVVRLRGISWWWLVPLLLSFLAAIYLAGVLTARSHHYAADVSSKDPLDNLYLADHNRLNT